MIAIAAVGLAMWACDKPRQGSSSAREAAVQRVFNDEHFSVGVAAIRSGRDKAVARVHVDPIAPFHMNLEFPTRLRVNRVGTDPTAPHDLDGTDAERLDEDALVFAFPFEAKDDGRVAFDCELEFAVCVTDECIPANLPLSFSVDVR